MTIVTVLSAALVIICVGIHLTCLKGLLALLSRIAHFRHFRVGMIVLGALIGHAVEIALFGIAFFFLSATERFGSITGASGKTLDWGDSFYYSAVTYTSLGFGDLTPTGTLRVLSAVEVLTGVVLVTWTASFLFLVMQKTWKVETDNRAGETG